MQSLPPQATTHYRICPFCEACCGLEVTVHEEQVIRIRGYQDDVLSEGYLCPKGLALKDLHEDPDRLRKPLIRRNGVLVEATWDEAFAEIAAHLPALQASYGRNTVGVVAGNPSTHKMGLMLYMPRLLRALGSRNFFSAATLDQIPRHVVSGLLYGQWMTIPIPDIARTQWLMVIGANPLASNGSMWTVPDFRGKAKALQARGGKLVVIDPRRTETAAIADEHQFITPSGDVFLLLGMVHTLFEERLVKLGRAGEWLDGVEAIQQVVQPYAPERVATACGIDALTIRRLARELATTPQAAVYGRMGVCVQQFGTLNTWLIDVLNILTGHLDAAGGTMFAQAAAFAANTQPKPADQVGKGRGIAVHRSHSRVSQAPEVMGEYPIGCMAEEITTPGDAQLRGLITIATNPVLSAPNGQQLATALQQLDFMVSLDIYVNETSCHANVILPGLSPLETSHYDIPYPQMAWRNSARYSKPVLAQPAGQPSEWEILLRLAAIMQGQPYDGALNDLDDASFADDAQRTLGPYAAQAIAVTQHMQGPERLLDVALRAGPYGAGFAKSADEIQKGLHLGAVQDKAGGVDLGALQPRLPAALSTPNGRIDLAPAMLLADLARVANALAAPVQAPIVTLPEGLSMRLIGRRDVRSNNSWMHNLPVLAKGANRCTALLHPLDAVQLQVTEGQNVTLRRAQQALEVPVEITEHIAQGLICLPHGWGHDVANTRMHLAQQRPGVNLNALLDETVRDPLSGNAELNGAWVTVQRTAQ